MTSIPAANRMTRRESDRSIVTSGGCRSIERATKASLPPRCTPILRISSRPPEGALHLALADAITPDMTIASVTERWPDTARIFARYGLGCASCAISKSETVLQGATGHGGGRGKGDGLLRDLNTFASTGRLPDGLPEASAVAPGGGVRVEGMGGQEGIQQGIAGMAGQGGVGEA